jgi:hypothetical protein
VSRKHDTDARKQSIQFQKMAKHHTCHRQPFESTSQVKKTENDAEIRTEIQSKSQNKTVEKPSECKFGSLSKSRLVSSLKICIKYPVLLIFV